MDEPTVLCLRSWHGLGPPRPFSRRRPDPLRHVYLQPRSAALSRLQKPRVELFPHSWDDGKSAFSHRLIHGAP